MFSVLTSDKANIHDLKVEIKKHWQEVLAHVDTMMLTVWRFSDEAPPFEFDDLETMQRLVAEGFSKKQVELLQARQKIACLNLSEEEVLLVQAPSTSSISTVVGSFSCVPSQIPGLEDSSRPWWTESIKMSSFARTLEGKSSKMTYSSMESSL